MATASSAKNIVEKPELTLYKALQRVEQKYNVPHDVWLMVERRVYKNLYNDSMDWVISDEKIHKHIARAHLIYRSSFCNYGRLMLHVLNHPWQHESIVLRMDVEMLSNGFQGLGCVDRVGPSIGGVEFERVGNAHNKTITLTCPNLRRYYWGVRQAVDKPALIQAIRSNLNGRKIKGLTRMTKTMLYQTLMKLDEFALVPSHANDKCVWHLP